MADVLLKGRAVLKQHADALLSAASCARSARMPQAKMFCVPAACGLPKQKYFAHPRRADCPCRNFSAIREPRMLQTKIFCPSPQRGNAKRKFLGFPRGAGTPKCLY